ncbi:hypothetical protein MKK65_15805 [Methylobacterium sp. J-001]|nr:hypothetical protein [Methylobacterium sp. J-001]MCJ2118013.1 hypothetical protein [Methylobacterium sp. J-001]
MMRADLCRPLAETWPPLTLPKTPLCRCRQTSLLPRMKRILCVVAALTLPALGITVADTVHRAGETRESQAANPIIPSDGAAAPSGGVTPARAARSKKIATLDPTTVEARS